jgi:threonine/homoserine/homoserine lactone efflux protein
MMLLQTHWMDIAIGMGMGLAYIAAPGPVNVETLRRGLTGGARNALSIQLGACTGHALWAALAFGGLGVLMLYPAAHLALGLAGIAVLLYLGWSSLREGIHILTNRTERTAVEVIRAVTLGGSSPLNTRMLGTGVVISITNPFAVAFWLSVGGTVLHQSGRVPELFLAGFFLSVLLWAIAVPLAIALARSFLQGRVQGWISSTCGLALVLFGFTLGHTLMAG